jgi:hypothetical protein
MIGAHPARAHARAGGWAGGEAALLRLREEVAAERRDAEWLRRHQRGGVRARVVADGAGGHKVVVPRSQASKAAVYVGHGSGCVTG